MRNSIINNIRNSLLIITFLITGSSYAEEKPIRIGYAFERGSTELLYIENHYQISSDEGPLHSWVVYTDKEGNKIAGKTNDFSNDINMPNFYLENFLTGHIESARMTENGFIVSFRRNNEGKVLEKEIEKPASGIIDAGFDNMIVNNWDKLINDEVLERKFLIPSLSRYIRFRVYQSEVSEDDGNKLRIINIEPANFLARLVAGTTRLSYDFSVPVLKEYNGISNMRDASGNNYDVVINYING